MAAHWEVGETVADDKPAHDRALELFVYAPVGVALYVRDMLPTMMGIFVSRGKREVQSHLPGNEQPEPPPAPSPADVRRKVEEGIGIARLAAESGVGVAKGGVGVAKGVAGSGIGVARGVAGTALQGLSSWRITEVPSTARPTAPAPPAPTTPAPPAAPTPRAPTAPRAPMAPNASPSTSRGARSASAAHDEHVRVKRRPTSRVCPFPTTTSCPRRRWSSGSKGSTAASLDAIRRYEAAHRGRKTILGKIAQLT